MRTNFDQFKHKFTTKHISTLQYPNNEMLSVTVEDIIKSEETEAALLPQRIKHTVRTSIGYITI